MAEQQVAPAEGTDNQAAEFTPSASFRAAMEAITKGEKDPEKLSQKALEGMDPIPSSDPAPGDGDGDGDGGEPKPGEGEGEEGEPKPGEGEEGEPKPKPGEGEEGSPQPKPGEGEQGEPKPAEGEEGEGEPLSRDAMRKEAGGTPRRQEAAPSTDELRGVHPSDPKRFRERVNHYEGLLKERDTKLETITGELAELKKQVEAAPTVPENVKEQLTELRQYRRRYALERDPEFQQKFTERVETSNALVEESLKQVGISEAVRKQIADAGGIANFMRTDAKIAIKGQKDKVSASKFVSMLLDFASEAAPDAKAVLESELANQRRIEAEQKRYLETESKEADKFFEELEKQESQSVEARKAADAKLEEVIGNFKTEVFGNDWMKNKEVPADASADDRKAIAEENKFRKKLRGFFDGQLKLGPVREAARRATNADELNEFASMLIDATRVFHVERDLDVAKKEIEALKKELDTVRNAGRSTPRKTTTVTGGRETPASDADMPKREDYDSNLAHSLAVNMWKKSKGIPIETP